MDGPIRIIVGTNTGVGKTMVGCGLVRAVAREGHRILALKPWETGCEGETPSDDEDGVLLAMASEQEAPRSSLVRLREPLAPPVAAERQGVTLDFEDMVRRIRLLAHGHSRVLIETAGGILSPLVWTHNALDLARALEAPLVLVGQDGLGTLSQTALAWTYAREQGHRVQAVVLSAPTVVDSSTGTNQRALLRMGLEPVLDLTQVKTVDEAADQLGPLAEELWP